MSLSDYDVKALKRIECAIHVHMEGECMLLELRSIGTKDVFFCKMPTTVWREFCRRQVSIPPPLPKRGAI